MDISDIVEPINGRDQGGWFFIVDIEGEYIYLANGKGRPVERPKKKKKRHVKLISRLNTETAVKMRNGQKVLNSELRRALAVFTAEHGQTEGGL